MVDSQLATLIVVESREPAIAPCAACRVSTWLLRDEISSIALLRAAIVFD
jgi:cytidine deaminase